MEPSIGMQEIFNFEFIGHFAHKGFALGKITVFPQIRKPTHFSPVHWNDAVQNHGDEFPRTVARRQILSRINGNQHALDEQIFRLHHQHFAIGGLHATIWRACKTFREADTSTNIPATCQLRGPPFAPSSPMTSCRSRMGRLAEVWHKSKSPEAYASSVNIPMAEPPTTTSSPPRSAHSALHSEAIFKLLTVGSCSSVMSASADLILLASMISKPHRNIFLR